MMKMKKRVRPMDYPLLTVTLIIVAYGLLMVFSASYYKAQSSSLYNYDGLYLFKRQAGGAILGAFAMLFMSYFDYHKLLDWRWPILIVSFILLFLVFVPGLGVSANGATRWIKLGPLPQLQPAELAKLAVIIFVAANIYKRRYVMDKFQYAILPNLIVLLLMCIPLYYQPNYSSIIMLAVLVFIMMYIGGAKGIQLLLVAVVGGAAGYALMMTQSYRVSRVATFMDPWAYASEGGHQIIQSLYGIGSGGLLGRGLGNSRQKYLWLPYGESDFIFSITCEELGLVGAAVLLVLFAVLIYRGMKIGANCEDLFGTMLASGITALIGIQALMNIAVATSSMPATGVPMPLFSYGSTSMVVFMAMIGILLNVSRHKGDITVPTSALERSARGAASRRRKIDVPDHS